MAVIKERIMKYVFMLTATISILAVLLICYFIFANSIPAINEIGIINFLFGKIWDPDQDLYGILPMIIGSIYVTAGAIIVGVPIGLMSAVFMAFYCPAKIYRPLKSAIELLAGIPSVVYGFFGLVVIVPVIQKIFGTSGKGVLTASLMLGMMILPTIINISESALRSVPTSYYEGALALGATHERSVFSAVFPAAKSGILAAVILGVGRAIGETMAVILIAGNQTVIPKSILSGVRTMTAHIVMEMGYAQDLHREALIATAAVLFVFILIINLCFSAVKSGSDREGKKNKKKISTEKGDGKEATGNEG